MIVPQDSSFYYENNISDLEDNSDKIDTKSSIIISKIDKTKCKAIVLLDRIQSGQFECAHCEKIFEYEPLLNIHCRDYHDIKKKKYHIKYDATSANSMVRKNDVKKTKIIHEDVKPTHKCEECDRKYFKKRDLDNHVMTVHEGKITKQSYKCDQCDLQFRLKNEFVNHNIKVHDLRDQGPNHLLLRWQISIKT